MKKFLFGLLSCALLFPVGNIYASPTTGTSNASITINPGDQGFTQLITNNLFFQPYTISATKPNQTNTSTHTFRVADFSGGLDGWTVTALFSDFVLDTNNDGTAEDRLSNHSASIDFKCGTTTFKAQPHSCQSDINRGLTNTGTAPTIIVKAPANTTSVGEFVYTIPTSFFGLKFENTIKQGTYKGTLTIDYSSVYTP